MKIQDVPQLDGYINLVEASEILGISRQHAGRLAANGAFESIRQIGTKQHFVVELAEVEKIRDTRAARHVAEGTSTA